MGPSGRFEGGGGVFGVKGFGLRDRPYPLRGRGMAGTMMLGIRAHDFGKLPADELSEKIAQKGFSYVHLALTKAIAGIDQNSLDLKPQLAHSIRKAFDRNNIRIAILGCYINLTHPDKMEKRKLLDRFCEHMRYARDFGCNIVATETGSINADYSFCPENKSERAFKILLESTSELVEKAEKFGVTFGIEGAWQHVVDTPDRMKELLDLIKSNHLKVVFDPVNFLSIDNYKNQESVVEKSIKLFGDKIVAIHIKDFTVVDGKMKVLAAGNGWFNYRPLLDFVKKSSPLTILETTDAGTVENSKKFIESLYEQE